MKKYEVMFIIRPNLDEQAREALVAEVSEVFTARASEVLNVKNMGLRELAYEISDETKGYYVVCKIEADEESLYEFRRHANISKTLLRYIIVVDQD